MGFRGDPMNELIEAQGDGDYERTVNAVAAGYSALARLKRANGNAPLAEFYQRMAGMAFKVGREVKEGRA